MDQWTADITADIDLKADNSVSYHALMDGAEWDPSSTNANIVMVSYLVYSR